MRAMVAGSLIVLAGSAGAALAQSEPVAVPGRPPMVTDPLRKIQISAFAAEPFTWAPPPPEMIRRTRADGDPATWLRETDAPIAAWLSKPALTNVTLVLQTGTDGTVTKCTSQEVKWVQPPALAGDLCPLVVSRARLVPALRDDGSRMSDRFILNINFAFSAYTRNLPGPLITSYGLSPAPPPPSDTNPKLSSWPPSGYWLRWAGREPAFKLPVEQPGGAALTGPAIGLVVADKKSGDPECMVVLSSGDARLDSKACDFARKKLKPEWAETVRFPVRRWPLLLSPDGKGFRAITGKDNAIKRLRVEPAELARLNALWHPQAAEAKVVQLSGALGLDGRPTSCRVYESSGSDVADAAACRLFRSEARFTPASDAFGQLGKLTGWVNLQLTPP